MGVSRFKKSDEELHSLQLRNSALPSEVKVRVIALISLFDRKQGRLGGRKVDQLT